MDRTPLLCKVLSSGLMLALLLGAQQIVAAETQPVAPARVSQTGWEDIKVWNFDTPSDLQEWERRDESSEDGGEYLWAENAYTYTTGTQSVWPLGNVLTATVDLPYPNHLDTWMVYTVSTSIPEEVLGVRLVFDVWLDVADGDTFSCLVSASGVTPTVVLSRSEQSKTWYEETAPLNLGGGHGEYAIAFRFQSNDDGRSGQGVFVDQVRLQYDYGYAVYLPAVLKGWPPLPGAVQLYEISKDPLDSAYTVSWSVAESTTPVTYTLQESTSPDFSGSLSYTSSITAYPVTGKGIGVYYYRVRAHNLWGASEWSNVCSTTVLSRRDDFDDPITGWKARRTSSPDLDLATTTYNDGRLETRLLDRWDFAVFSPMIQAPPALPYRIILRTRIVHQANLTAYGVVFGGNGGRFCSVDRSTAGDSDGCFYHYYRLNVVWGGYLKYQLKRIDYHEWDKGKAQGKSLQDFRDISDLTNPDGWNTWEIEVYDYGFKVFVNGHQVNNIKDATYVHEPYYGIFTSTDEYNNATFEHEHFYVDPLPAESRDSDFNWQQVIIPE